MRFCVGQMKILAEAVVCVADRVAGRNKLAQETLDGGGRFNAALLEDLHNDGARVGGGHTHGCAQVGTHHAVECVSDELALLPGP